MSTYWFNVFPHILTLQVSKQFFPNVAIRFDDPRVNLVIGDGTILPLCTYVVISKSSLF